MPDSRNRGGNQLRPDLLSQQPHPEPVGVEEALLDRLLMMSSEFDAAADTWSDRDDLPEHCQRLAKRAREIHETAKKLTPSSPPLQLAGGGDRERAVRQLTNDVTRLLGSLDWALRWIEETGEVPLRYEEPEAFAEYEKARSYLQPPLQEEKEEGR